MGGNKKLVLVCITFALISLVGVASAETIYVPDDYAKIQWAVDNATKGDTIIVRDGTYQENVDVKKRLTIRSENGSANTIVQAANPKKDVFSIEADYVNITGFTVTGASSGTWTSGFRINDADYCTISENNVHDNKHGIRLSGSSSHNIIRDNTVSSNNGYGIYLTSDSTDENKIIYNSLISNEAGVYINNADSNNISFNYIFNNTYGIYLKAGSTDNTIKHNNIIANGEYNSTTGGYEWQFYNDQAQNVIAEYNWWGTDNESQIDASIYDDEEGKGEVDFDPYLSNPYPGAPIPELTTPVLVALGLLVIAGIVYRRRV